MHFKCCEKENKMMICASRGSGERSHVSICHNCGEFEVSANKDGVWFNEIFRVWSPNAVRAIVANCNEALRDGGEEFKIELVKLQN